MTPVRYWDFIREPKQERAEYFDWLRIRVSDEEQALLDIGGGNVPAGVLFTWRAPGIWQVLTGGRIGRYA